MSRPYMENIKKADTGIIASLGVATGISGVLTATAATGTFLATTVVGAKVATMFVAIGLGVLLSPLVCGVLAGVTALLLVTTIAVVLIFKHLAKIAEQKKLQREIQRKKEEIQEKTQILIEKITGSSLGKLELKSIEDKIQALRNKLAEDLIKLQQEQKKQLDHLDDITAGLQESKFDFEKQDVNPDSQKKDGAQVDTPSGQSEFTTPVKLNKKPQEQKKNRQNKPQQTSKQEVFHPLK